MNFLYQNSLLCFTQEVLLVYMDTQVCKAVRHKHFVSKLFTSMPTKEYGIL